MEGRRKPPVRTYGRSARSQRTDEKKQSDAFDTLFISKIGAPADSVAKSTLKRVSPALAVKDDDPFAFGDDDVIPPKPKEVKKQVLKSTKTKSKSETTFAVADSCFKGDSQMKIDQFTISLPRLKASNQTNTKMKPMVNEKDHHSPPPVREPSPSPVEPVPARQIFTTNRGERRKVANVRSWFAEDDEEEEEKSSSTTTLVGKSSSGESVSSSQSGSLKKRHPSTDSTMRMQQTMASVTRIVTDGTGKRSVRVIKSEKDNYAIVKHVRGVSELKAEGSSLEFDGDYNYLIECLGSSTQLSSRCLSALQLVSKCAETSDFRLYLKSTGKLSEVFDKLEDSDKHSLLAFCTTAVFLVLSSDRSQVDLDTKSLNLLVRLVKMETLKEWDSQLPQQIVDRVTKGVVSVLKNLQRKYGAEFGSFIANVGSPTVIKDMALFALHTMCQRCSSETMQNEFRESGALEILVRDCVDCLKDRDLTEDGFASYTKKIRQITGGVLKLINKNKENKKIASEFDSNALALALADFVCAIVPDAKTFLKTKPRYSVPDNELRILLQCFNLLMVLCCDSSKLFNYSLELIFLKFKLLLETTCAVLSQECPDFLSATIRLAIIGNNSLESVHCHFDLSILVCIIFFLPGAIVLLN